MEERRLKPMKAGYDEKLFNQIYRDTAGLRNKLAFDINPHKFGVETKDIRSFFDIKFIFVFNKYYGEVSNDLLKGHIISALQTYKYRLLKYAYRRKNETLNTVDISDLTHIATDDIDYPQDLNTMRNMVNDYMKSNLSPEAFQLFQIEITPPPYIMQRLKGPNSRIPAALLVEFIGDDNNEKSIKKIRKLRKEIKDTTQLLCNS